MKSPIEDPKNFGQRTSCKEPSLPRSSFQSGSNKPKASCLRWLWPYIKKHWKRGTIILFGIVTTSLLSLPTPYLMKILIDKAIGGKDLRLLNMMVLAMFGIQAILFGTSWATKYLFNRFSHEITTRIKKDLFSRILRFPMSFFDKYQTGYIMSRVGEIDNLDLIFSSALLYVVISSARFIFCLGLLIHLNAKLTAVSLLFLPVLFWITRLFTKWLQQLSWHYYEKSAVIKRGIHDSLSGIEVIKSFGTETREAAKYQRDLNDLKNMSLRRTILLSLYSESLSFLVAGTGFIILWWSSSNIISGQFTLGSYLAFAAYFAQLLNPIQLIANFGLTLQPAKVALQRIQEFLDIITEDESMPAQTIQSLYGTISLRDIDFAFEAARPVFIKASLKINPREKILIAGPNGSGKSTLIKLIMGFYRPQGGEILFDGLPLNNISLVSLRKRIAIVSQNIFLFSDTIRNNVLYGAPGATNEELEEALRLSGAADFVQAMPKGLETEIGERGLCLSGGERQKLSIARAILKDSDLIIFDEATTNLDKVSFQLLCDLIKNRFTDKTCLIISHRPIGSSIINHVYWIEQGRIQELSVPPESDDEYDSTHTTI